MARNPGAHEAFSRFFESPSRELLREVLQDHTGEKPHLDFKQEWPERPELARHVLGMLNSGGGCIIVGVAEQPDKSVKPTGLTNISDKVEIEKSVRKFLPQETHTQLNVLDFSYDAAEYPTLIGKKFQVLIVDFEPLNIPVVASGGTTNLREGAIYVRRLASTEEANHDEVKKLINAHVGAASALRPALDLKSHLSELRVLYAEVPAYRDGLVYGELVRSMFGRNPNAPKEGLEQFVVRLIEQKKRIIEKAINA